MKISIHTHSSSSHMGLSLMYNKTQNSCCKLIQRRAKNKLNIETTEEERRNSAQKVVQTCNFSVRDRITQYQLLVIKSESPSPTRTPTNQPCSIVVSNYDEANRTNGSQVTDNASKRQSLISNSSIESSRSDNNNRDDGNIVVGETRFYVVWD